MTKYVTTYKVSIRLNQMLAFVTQRNFRDKDGKEECRASKNDLSRAYAEILSSFAPSADHQDDEEEINEEDDWHDRSRNQRAQKVPFDSDAVVQLGMQLLRLVAPECRSAFCSGGCDSSESLLHIPVFPERWCSTPGNAAGTSKSIRSSCAREVGKRLRS